MCGTGSQPPPPVSGRHTGCLGLCRDPPTRRPYHMCGMPCPCCRGPPPLTMDTVRQNCVTISGIKDQDLLYFSHSNVALSHLPYMVALDR